jgi:hypothetical protein
MVVKFGIAYDIMTFDVWIIASMGAQKLALNI